MYNFTVYLENESGSRLHPISVEEGARRVPRLEDAASFAVVDGELHVRHCGKECAEVRIQRSGRERAVRPGQSYRVMPGDSLCVANRAYRISEVYRKERPKRSLLGMTARSIALGAATAAAMLVGCNTDASRNAPETAPIAAEAPAVADANPAVENEKPAVAADVDAVDIKPWAGKPGPEWVDIANCANAAKSVQDKAGCCMSRAETNEVGKECCDWVHKLDPSVRCEVDVDARREELRQVELNSDAGEKPRRPIYKDCLTQNESAKDKANCCMGLASDGDRKACCDDLHKTSPDVFCTADVLRAAGAAVRSLYKTCLDKPGSADDKAKCCMGLPLDGDRKACCDELHQTAPDVYCEVKSVRTSGAPKTKPDPVAKCLAQNESADDKANCCMGLASDGDRKACCDELHQTSPDVYCTAEVIRDAGVKRQPLYKTCLTQNESADDKAGCCMGLSLDRDRKKCCDELHKTSPDVYCTADVIRESGVPVQPTPVAECLAKTGSADDKAKCCMGLKDKEHKKLCCDTVHEKDPGVQCSVDSVHLRPPSGQPVPPSKTP